MYCLNISPNSEHDTNFLSYYYLLQFFAFKPVLWKNLIMIGFTTVLIKEQMYFKCNVLYLYKNIYSLISSYAVFLAAIITLSFRFLTGSYIRNLFFLLSYTVFKV